jgi:hypothetical protein
VRPGTLREKAEQLVKSVDLVTYNSIIARYIIMIEQPVEDGQVDTFPTYNTVKDELFRYDNILKRLRTAGQPSGDQYSGGRSSSTAYFVNQNHGSLCYNCLEHGHYSNVCRNPPKCSHCGGTHRSNQHNAIMSGRRDSNNSYQRHEHDQRSYKNGQPKKFKLVKMISKSSSSSTHGKPTSGGVVHSAKKQYKKPFEAKHRDNPSKKFQKVYLMQEVDDDYDNLPDDHYQNDYYDYEDAEDIEVDESDPIFHGE